MTGENSAVRNGLRFRMAEVEETPLLARMVLDASGGIFQYLLADLLPGTEPETLLGLAVADDTAASGYPNIFVAEERGEIAGMICAYDSALFGVPDTLASFVPPGRIEGFGEFFRKPLPPGYYVQTVYVSPSCRGRGVGKALLERAEMLAVEMGYGQFLLHVWEDNAPALALYRGWGLQEAERISIPERGRMGHRCDKFLMKKSLRNPV